MLLKRAAGHDGLCLLVRRLGEGISEYLSASLGIQLSNNSLMVEGGSLVDF
jgi:hypothetical protein